jgi:hypothetical protein
MMHTITRRLTLSCVLLLITAYLGSGAMAPHRSGAPTPADPDAVVLTTLGGQARQRAREAFSDVILLQVYTDLTQTAFRFKDRTEQTEIRVLVPTPTTPVGQWPVHADPLVISGPGIGLEHLSVGPNRAATAMLAHWPGCARSGLGLNLFGQDAQLVWDITCSTAAGVVKGTMDNQTGVFHLTNGPALPPPTALP